MGLETIICIPYSDGSEGIASSGMYIKTPNLSIPLKIRNADFCPVFRSELIATEKCLIYLF